MVETNIKIKFEVYIMTYENPLNPRTIIASLQYEFENHEGTSFEVALNDGFNQDEYILYDAEAKKALENFVYEVEDFDGRVKEYLGPLGAMKYVNDKYQEYGLDQEWNFNNRLTDHFKLANSVSYFMADELLEESLPDTMSRDEIINAKTLESVNKELDKQANWHIEPDELKYRDWGTKEEIAADLTDETLKKEIIRSLKDTRQSDMKTFEDLWEQDFSRTPYVYDEYKALAYLKGFSADGYKGTLGAVEYLSNMTGEDPSEVLEVPSYGRFSAEGITNAVAENRSRELLADTLEKNNLDLDDKLTAKNVNKIISSLEPERKVKQQMAPQLNSKKKHSR